MIEHLAHIADVAVVIVPLAIWFWRWSGKLDNTIVLNKQVVVSHVPFIYTRLKVHDNALGIDNPEHPPLGIMPNGSGH